MSLPSSVTNKIKARSQSVKFAATLDIVFNVAGYCCNIDSDAIMGVSKEPVVILSLSPNPVCLGNSVAYNFAGSYAPGSTVTSYTINWGDGNEDTGSSGTHTYGSAGTYTVSATVEEGSGLSSTIEFEVNVIDCTGSSYLAQYWYAIVYGQGVFLGEWS